MGTDVANIKNVNYSVAVDIARNSHQNIAIDEVVVGCVYFALDCFCNNTYRIIAARHICRVPRRSDNAGVSTRKSQYGKSLNNRRIGEDCDKESLIQTAFICYCYIDQHQVALRGYRLRADNTGYSYIYCASFQGIRCNPLQIPCERLCSEYRARAEILILEQRRRQNQKTTELVVKK